MKLPSIHYLVSNAKVALLRFPLTILSSLVAVIVAIYLVEYNDEIDNLFPYVNLLLTAALGIPLYFSVSVFTESTTVGKYTKAIGLGVATLVLVFIYFTLPNAEDTHNTSVPYIRYGVYNVIIHLLASFIPYLTNKKHNGFWNFNKILFIRLWMGVLYSAFLFIGLAMALGALHLLFEITIHEELYFEIYIVIIGLFNTWFFTAGIPKKLEDLEDMYDYPKGLKIFSQYVLLPLLLLYLAILYAYTGKIIIEWNWPKGIVSYLISCVAVLGIFNFLLMYPFSDTKENSWIKSFSKIYYFILFPLIIILFIAIGMRVDAYGITINRYAIVVLGIWLTIISVYFSIGKTNLKFIPQSLAVILLLTVFGPWSMFSVSARSQTNRLMSILETNDLITSSKIKNEVIWQPESLPEFLSENKHSNQNQLTDSLNNEVKSIIDYLDIHHGFYTLRPLVNQNIDSLIIIANDSNSYFDEARVYMETLGLKYEHAYTDETYFYYSSQVNDAKLVKGYNYSIEVSQSTYYREEQTSTFALEGINYKLRFTPEKNNEYLLISDSDTTTFKLDSLIQSLIGVYGSNDEFNIPLKKLTLEASSPTIRSKLILNNLYLEKKNNTIDLTRIEGYLLVKFNE